MTESAGRREPLTEADYERAMALWPARLVELVRNVSVAPHWLPGEDRFWFREQVEGGHRYRLVDAATGEQAPAFDHARVAAALGVDEHALPVERLERGPDGFVLFLSDRRARIDASTCAVESLPAPDETSLHGPGGRALFARGHDLWLREPDGRERALTDDGAAHAAWGAWPDADLRAVDRSRGRVDRPPFGCFWSPDGRQVLALRLDERGLEPYPYLESVPADGSPRPEVHWVRQQLAGESEAGHRWQLIEVDGEVRVDVRLPDAATDLRIRAESTGCVFWRPGGRRVVVLASSSNDDHVALLEIDRSSGATRVVHEERSATWFDVNTFQYSAPNLRLLPGGDELLWYSQSDGWGHLYVVDLDRGGIVRRLTAGAWAVQDVIGVADGAVFFTACGREPGRHPYYRHLYRVDLDAEAPGQGSVLLTPEDADHPMSPGAMPIIAALLRLGAAPSALSSTGRYVVDTHSTVARPPVTVVRDARDGRLVAEVLQADVSALQATGWKAPEIFTAKGADGDTDLFGVVIVPRDFDAARRYPIVERIYGGPQIVAQPRNFAEALTNGFVYGAYALAEFGFVVVIVDGPGTPCRSKAFHDMPYGAVDRWGIAHHRAAITGAAATRPWMDCTRVGLCGHSYGGYGTAMALLLEPDFYRVGVSSAGMYDPMWAPSTPQRHIGRPDFGHGRHVKARGDEVAANYLALSPSHHAHRLEGRLLLVYGDLDENIQPAALLAFTQALIRAGKHFDTLCLPGRNHGFTVDVYFQKRLWDYFVEHLQGREPLRHLKLVAEAGPRVLV